MRRALRERPVNPPEQRNPPCVVCGTPASDEAAYDDFFLCSEHDTEQHRAEYERLEKLAKRERKIRRRDANGDFDDAPQA